MAIFDPHFSGSDVYFPDGNINRFAASGFHSHYPGVAGTTYANRQCYRASGSFAALLCLFAPAFGLGAELDVFRLTGIKGSLEFDYSVEDLEVKRVDGPTTTQRRPVSEQKLKLETAGYIYHPNLVDMELGAGIRFRNEEYETDLGSNESKQTLYSFNSSFNILKEKPYPINIYYNQRNPTYTVGLADSMTTENRDYGLLLSLQKPLTPFPLWLSANHSESKGEGRGTLIDYDYDYQQIRMSVDNIEHFIANLSLDHSRRRSGSGSMNLPTQSTLKETYSFDYGSTLHFGEKSRNAFVTLLSYDIVDFKSLEKSEDVRFYTSLELNHSKTLETYYRYNIENTKYSDSESEFTNQSLSTGLLSDITESLTFSGNLDIWDEENQGFDKNTYSANSALRYETDLSEDATFTTTYSLNYIRNKQQSDLNQIPKIGEQHLLEDLLPVMLNNEYVIPGSIVVSNPDRTQTYIENLDYVLTVIGSETRLERLLTGNIPDGEAVLVDYEYESGGTYEYGTFKQSLSAGLSLYNTYRFHASYSKQDEELIEGRPLRPLYSKERAMVSADARYRLSRTMGFTWHLEATKETGKLRPFMRKEGDISYTTALPFLSSFLELRSRYENIDNKMSEEDMNLTRHGFSLFARTGFRSRIRLDYSVEKDNGGSLPREVRRGGLSYDWAWRLLSFSLQGKYSLEEQGGASREDSSIYLSLIRKL
jgi:hypothetical protein